MTTSAKSWSQMVSPNPSTHTNNSVQQQCAQQSRDTSCVSLNEIMSEQLVDDLVLNENKCDDELSALRVDCDGAQAVLKTDEFDELADYKIDCSSDEMLANMLQNEFDLQHDQNLKREEKKINANSKVSLSFDLYRRLPNESIEADSDDEYHEFGEQSKHWDSFERSQKQEMKIGRQGFAVNKDGSVTTKHDLEMTARRNACKVMEFDSDLRTGDGGCFDMKLNNNVYNSLKVHSINEGKRMAREKEKKQKSTAVKVMDEKSRILILKLINRGIIESINGVIATGKESVVFHGIGNNNEKGITSCEIAIKVFKTTLNEFKNRDQYILGDPLLHQTTKLSKQNPKFMIPLWAEKEMHNLNRMRRNGMLCPDVVLLKKHILVMTFIGTEGRPASLLKEAKLSEEDMMKAWKQTVDMMVKLYRDCDLIHGDLSAYNLLWHQNKIWCIDVSQAVLSTHPMAFKFLWRDCKNIHNFFAKQCIPMMTVEELFATVCGKQINSDSLESFDNAVDLLDKIENYERNEELLRHDKNTNDSFDEMFNKSLCDKQSQTKTSNACDITAKSPPKDKFGHKSPSL